MSALLLNLMLMACSGDIETKESDTAGDSLPVQTELPELYINEFMASNTTTLADEAGEFDDWMELYNGGDTLVSMDGIYLTDDDKDKTQWAIPSSQGLAPGDFMIIWCDGTPNQGEMHTSFKLNKGGDKLLLYKVESGHQAARIDGVEWSTEQPDLAAARVPDGSDNWVHQAGTPGESNGG